MKVKVTGTPDETTSIPSTSFTSCSVSSFSPISPLFLQLPSRLYSFSSHQHNIFAHSPHKAQTTFHFPITSWFRWLLQTNMRDDNKIKLEAKGYGNQTTHLKKIQETCLSLPIPTPFLLSSSPLLTSSPQLPSRITCLTFSSLSGKFLPPFNTSPFLSTCTFFTKP